MAYSNVIEATPNDFSAGKVETTAIRSGGDESLPDFENFFQVYSQIWIKMLMLARELRNIMQEYNQKKQELNWQLITNALMSKYEAIADEYHASQNAAFGKLAGGVLGLGSTLVGARFGDMQSGAAFGNVTSSMASGTADLIASEESYEAKLKQAIAELQDKGAQSYNRTVDDLLEKAREIMQKTMDMGRGQIEVLKQILQALSSR